ncbi:helix-turn-helix domain-containing protein [Thermoflavimicrobium daqui]|jgi:transcriptional regulator with XRE-family HTH domain|uniref:XRE family transcriptional regulator n=1 Tax=Thermoflavimicrobium daqui TaxID=2137476 RepID=A0A364K0G5_9BACL|nr:helix-turn-helix transcriptional regulator [Thermoflavimicrobium daqui]RAL20832.1 XRE family transcriptional regulator [Thermoflavimicrobium daqui]
MVGVNIKRLRKKQGITQTVLAQSVGIRQESLSRIEKGRLNPSLSTLTRIAKELNISVSTLLGEEQIVPLTLYRYFEE